MCVDFQTPPLRSLVAVTSSSSADRFLSAGMLSARWNNGMIDDKTKETLSSPS